MVGIINMQDMSEDVREDLVATLADRLCDQYSLYHELMDSRYTTLSTTADVPLRTIVDTRMQTETEISFVLGQITAYVTVAGTYHLLDEVNDSIRDTVGESMATAWGIPFRSA